LSIKTEYGLGIYAVSEGQYLVVNKDTPRDGTRRGVLCLHGHGADATVFTPGAQSNTFAVGNHARTLAEAGFIVLSIDAGGPAPWSNDPSMTAITAAHTWLTGAGGAKAGIVGLVGWSMGGLNALNWVKRNPTLVSGVELFAPASDLDYFHGLANFQTEIDIAYSGQTTSTSGSGTVNGTPSTVNVGSTSGFGATGQFGIGVPNTTGLVSYTGITGTSFTGCTMTGSFSYSAATKISRIGDYATNSVGHNPTADAASFTSLTTPIRIYHGSADATVPLSQSQNFVAAAANGNFSLVTLAGAGHTNLFGYFSITDTQQFFLTYLGLS
jgi:pimeloyl-ACP methyl ester carboxylesterase